jgi:monofunctional biosynthetic peptidoglycan transglycosylase
MRLRAEEARRAGRQQRVSQRWMPYRQISGNLKRAVLVAFDTNLFRMRGASTITQQLAKNLYLSPSRNPYRKVTELFVARRLEAELPKARIFELYLNLIEWGDGIWGADAAARAYFGRPASDLSPEEAALMAGAIINPRIYTPRRPNARLLRRQQIILRRMGQVLPPVPAPTSVPDPVLD